MIFILYFINFRQINDTANFKSGFHVPKSKLKCDNLKIFFDNNITLFCGNNFDYSIRYDQLPNFEIDVTQSVNFINTSFINSSILFYEVINESIYKTNETKIIFTDFVDISVIDDFAEIFSSSLQNMLISINWERYITDNISFCQWDHPSGSPAFNAVRQHLEVISDTSRWKKICLNNRAFLHYVAEPTGEIIMIPYTTMVLLIVFAILLVIGILVSLYLIALYKFNHAKKGVGNQCETQSSHGKDGETEGDDKTDCESHEKGGSDERDGRSKDSAECESQYSIELDSHESSDDAGCCCHCACCDRLAVCFSNVRRSDKMLVFVQFFKQLLGIGNSAGSLVSEAIHLLRIFQRLSATRTFSVHFSSDCLRVFAWATNILDIIFSSFYLRSFYDIELFYIINYVFPLIMITFMVLLFLNFKYYLLLLISAAFVALGFGFGYIQFSVKVGIAFVIPFLFLDTLIVLVILYLLRRYGFDVYHFIEYDQYTVLSAVGKFYLPFSFTVFNTLVITFLFLIPFFVNDRYFLGTCIFVFFVLLVIAFVIDILIGSLEDFVSISVILVNNLPLLFTNILTLLFVPSTDLFVELMLGEYESNWNCIVGFIAFALVLPAVITWLLIFFGSSDLLDKYRDVYFVYYEFIDMARQIVYAFVSAYDLPWACIMIEICWILAFSIPKIYNSPSEYVLQGGSSLIIITGNTIALVCKYTHTAFISFKWFLLLVCAAFLLAVVAFYVYFATEFQIEEDDPVKKEERVKLSIYVTIFFMAITPIAWFFFGMFIPIIMNHFNEFNSNCHDL